MDRKELTELIREFCENISGKTSMKLACAVATYKYLRNTFHDKETPIEKEDEFCRTYKLFYVMRYLSGEFTGKYFEKLIEYKRISNQGREIPSLEITCRDMEGCSDGKFHFSFITKLMNLADDSRYVIYDKYVASVLGYKEYRGAKSGKTSVLCERLGEIKTLYDGVLSDLNKSPNVIDKFWGKIGMVPCISGMRVMDFLVWQAGKERFAGK